MFFSLADNVDTTLAFVQRLSRLVFPVSVRTVNKYIGTQIHHIKLDWINFARVRSESELSLCHEIHAIIYTYHVRKEQKHSQKFLVQDRLYYDS